MRTVMAVLLSIALVACGSANSDTTKQAPINSGCGAVSNGSGNQSLPNQNQNEADSLTFQNFSVIREFDGTDTAALLVILPSSGTLTLSKVGEVGADFLPGYATPTINAGTVKEIFAHSSHPMPQSERIDILTKYNGVTAVYVEGYNDTLCSDQEFKIEIFGTIGASGLSFTFDQSRVLDSSGECKPHVDLFEQQPWSGN